MWTTSFRDWFYTSIDCDLLSVPCETLDGPCSDFPRLQGASHTLGEISGHQWLHHAVFLPLSILSARDAATPGASPGTWGSAG